LLDVKHLTQVGQVFLVIAHIFWSSSLRIYRSTSNLAELTPVTKFLTIGLFLSNTNSLAKTSQCGSYMSPYRFIPSTKTGMLSYTLFTGLTFGLTIPLLSMMGKSRSPL
jgi:hypothetical protein